jgi:ketosteroid isomerase-like protein
MEVLNTMFQLADLRNLFTSLRALTIHFRVSLYADDLVVFVVPREMDMRLVHAIMELFADASGLCTNISNCQFTTIQLLDF